MSQSGSSDNVLSQRNTYDALDRLTGTQVGALDNSGNIPSPDRSDTWNLDLLGNWVGTSGGTAAGRVTTVGSTTTSFGYGVDQRNRMTSTTTGSGTKGVRYDPAGNLQFDGTYYYQYDAWNRLLQVNLGYWDGGTGGQDTGTIAIGALVKNYAFDGLGRLARTVSPYPNPSAAGGFNRTERFYYDGIRRIQEVYTDPVVSAAAAETSGDSTLQQLGNQTTPPNGDPQGTPLGLEAGQIGGVTPIQPTPWLEREYVWGPGDGPGGIDELLVQYDNQRNPWWVIQDEGGDVAAICDLGAVNQDGRVAGQYTYDAYGSPLSFDNLHAHPLMHCGHKGLFVDRLDVGVVATAGGPESPRLVPYAHLICHDRNRSYIPQVGRFLQADPNATGKMLLASAVSSGRGIGAIAAAFDLEGMYGDGSNLYEYLGSNPWRRSDVLGTSWDPFSMVDEFNAEFTGNVAAVTQRVVGFAQTAAFVAAMVVSQLPFPIGSMAADFAAGALEGNGIPSELLAARKILGYASLTVLAATVTKIGVSAISAAVHYVIKHGFVGTIKNLWRGAKSLAKRAWNWLKGHKGAACGCFARGTLVWTVAGLVPIEQIHEGAYVLARDVANDQLRFMKVTKTLETFTTVNVRIGTRNASGGDGQLDTTEEHPFWRTGRVSRGIETIQAGWCQAGELLPGDTVRTATGDLEVIAVSFDARFETVYNFSVEGLATYHVGTDGILVHNVSAGDCWPKASEVTSIAHIPPEYKTWPKARANSDKGWKYTDPKNPGRQVREMEPVTHEGADPRKLAGYTRYSDGYGGTSDILPGILPDP